ncbi:MAG TPA: hypothetical protein VKZ63_21285 [Kofleriaceae bacterium]|nr:hypothetical protein [Kofleriaceae bacterium]
MRSTPAAPATVAALAALALGSACSKEDKAPAPELLVEDDRTAPVQVLGVSPVDFTCDSIAPLEAVEAAIGRPLELVDAAGFSPPEGVPKPCNYVSALPDMPGEWSFDLDCRERAIGDGERLMAQYATDPEASGKPIQVGRSGIDHHDSQILFFDDDAPCYVRVNGPGAAERLALARLIADSLNRRNAPGKVSFVEVTTGEMQPGTGASP